MITIRNLSKAYGKKEVLKGVNLDLERGRIYGLVGINGSGKTTLFRCLAGLETYSGSVRSEFPVLKDHLGFLPTHPVFLSHITGWEYLKLFNLARGIRSEGFEQKNMFDLPLDQYAEHYSTGMKKKLAFLALLLQKNEVFLLDEPFNGVDLPSNLLMGKILTRLRSEGKVILISSHILPALKDQCDQVHYLDEGIISASFMRGDFHQLDRFFEENLGQGGPEILDFL